MRIIKCYQKDNNRKYGIMLKDGTVIETALFEHRAAIHFCVPTQVGCNMRCRHCSTTYSTKPYIRNLSSNELIEMIELMKGQLWKNSLPWVLSFSGHGEPMLNWDSIEKCVNKVQNDFFSIYVTSIGFVPVMEKILKESAFQPNIYFSIHGSNDKERAQLIPATNERKIAKLHQIIDFGKSYTQQGGVVVWNYMICNINSSETSLCQFCMLCECIDYPLEIRLTKYIDICKETGIKENDDTIIQAFYQNLLKQLPSNIQIRLSKLEGEEMGIACGQMRASLQENVR